jgi:regulatory protein
MSANPKQIIKTEASPERSLKSRAVAYLSRREHSRVELAQKLSPFESDPLKINVLLDLLAREGWQSDERFVNATVNAKSFRQGRALIEHSLRQKGVDKTLIEAMTQTLAPTEYDRACDVWQRRFGLKPFDPSPQGYAKQARFLISRGFQGEIVRKVLATLRNQSNN